MTFYEAMEVARENLSALPAKFVGPQSGEGAYLSATGDSYDASRLLLTDIIRQFKVKGDPVAMIPNRENLVVVGSEDAEGLSGMLKMATEALKQPRPISGIALRLDGDEWVPWLPDVSHPLYKDFQRLHLQSLGQDYAEQKDLLDKLHEKKGEDVFVASFSAIQAPDGRVFSYATWTETTNSLLPKTDALVLGRVGGEPRMVEWQKVMDVAGDLMEPLDIYPPRYRVREFPSGKAVGGDGEHAGMKAWRVRCPYLRPHFRMRQAACCSVLEGVVLPVSDGRGRYRGAILFGLHAKQETDDGEVFAYQNGASNPNGTTTRLRIHIAPTPRVVLFENFRKEELPTET